MINKKFIELLIDNPQEGGEEINGVFYSYYGMATELKEQIERLEDEFNDLCDSYHNLKQDFLEVENEKKVLVDACKNYLKEHYNTKKVIDILKNKKVNLFHIWVFDDYTQYKEHYPFAEYNAEEDMLTTEEFDFLKEWLENES